MGVFFIDPGAPVPYGQYHVQRDDFRSEEPKMRYKKRKMSFVRGRKG